MAAIKNFFEKKRLQARFKLAGSGHKLTEDNSPTPSSSNASLSDRRQTASQQRPATEESKRAGAAALARFDHQQSQIPTMANRSQQVIRAEAMKELEAEKMKAAASAGVKESEGNVQHSPKARRETDSTPRVLSVSGVYFQCPLVTPEILSKVEITERIREFLYQQLTEDKEVTPCYMIHTLNTNKLKVSQGIQTLSKYLENVIDNPSDLKYRKIRIQNRVFQERVASLEGASDFLLAAGFQIEWISSPEDSPPEEFYVFVGEDTDTAQRMLDTLLTTEPITPDLDRNLKVLLPADGAKRMELPQEFFDLTAEDVKREQKLRSEQIEKNAMLRTKAMREKDEVREVKNYKYSLVRIKFPDGVVLQGTFLAHEKLSAVQEFVREALVNDWQPFILTSGTGQRLTEFESTLAELRLVPAVVLHFAWDPEVAAEVKRETGNESDEFLNEATKVLIQQFQRSL